MGNAQYIKMFKPRNETPEVVIGTILCIDTGYGDLTGKLTVGKTYNYIKKERASWRETNRVNTCYQYYVLCDDGACRVLADYRFKDISKLREEKLDFLLDE